MGTRSVLARPEGDGFAGVYAHWDGYPTCKGPELFDSLKELGGDVSALRDYAIREGTSGYWSSFMPPSDVAAQLTKPEFVTCNLCDGTGVRPDWKGTCGYEGCNGCPDRERVGNGPGTGMMSNRERTSNWVPQDSPQWITSQGDDGGTEWAYVIGDNALVVFVRRYGTPDDDKGYGMGAFGMGASDTEAGGYWRMVDTVKWDEDPDWSEIERRGGE